MSALGYGVSLRTKRSTIKLVIAGVILLGVWEVTAQIVKHRVSNPNSVLPTLENVAHSVRGLSDYWQGGWGVASTQSGGPETLAGAALALAYNALVSAERLVFGMVAAVAFGIGLGLVVGYFRAARRFAFAPVHLLGLFPSLGLVPLFAFWFGPTTEGVIALVGWGAGILMLRVTLNAVENVPLVYIQAGQTLGASGLHLYRTVIIPATLPELRGGLLIAVTYAWTFVLGAELIGVQSGLGRLMFLAYRFTQIGRMVVIGVTFIFLATVSVMLFHRGADWLTRWAK